jgi:RNA recognition motif-containing protein
VTRAEDLELIFSRFGECKAEIIKDKVTGESLCYGFIEFPDRKCCEQAFFKMNNCLIDDRRIRVDFSQSVAKLWNRVRRGYHDRFDEKESVQSMFWIPLQVTIDIYFHSSRSWKTIL